MTALPLFSPEMMTAAAIARRELALAEAQAASVQARISYWEARVPKDVAPGIVEAPARDGVGLCRFRLPPASEDRLASMCAGALAATDEPGIAGEP